MLKKFVSISLTLLLLLGNLSITFGTHFCGGHPVVSELMFGEKHLDCGMVMMDLPMSTEDSAHYSAPGCCENQYVTIESDDTFTKSVNPDHTNTLVAVAVFHVLYTYHTGFTQAEAIANDTSPPLRKQDFTVLHQVFRI